MRKALIAVAFASALATLSPAHAVNVQSFTIQRSTVMTGLQVPCASQGFSGDDFDCKGTAFNVARCLYLTDPDTAQPANREGLVGYIFKVNATKIRGATVLKDYDNHTFDLIVTNKVSEDATGDLDLPDVDIAFYQSLGNCPGDQGTDPDDQVPYVPVNGPGAVLLREGFYGKGTYTSPGDEINKKFPTGYYDNPDNQTEVLLANEYFAVVTIIGGADVEVDMRCDQCTDGTWFKML